MLIGSHVSFNKEQLLGSLKEALSYKATTFMFYTGAPQNTIRKQIDANLTRQAIELMKENNIDINKVIVHAPYIINLANNSDMDKYNFSCNFLKEEITRVESMHLSYIVLHPGNSLKLDRNIALNNISNALNKVIDKNTKVTILLETMAGKGTECGINIQELKTIIDNVNYPDKIGICLDTCHLNDSGVDISKIEDYLKEFDEIIGIDKIKCIHLNDSKNIIGSRKDRHENIGYGTIGFDNLIKVAYLDIFKDIPKILETPYINNVAVYKEEIEEIKTKVFNTTLKD